MTKYAQDLLAMLLERILVGLFNNSQFRVGIQNGESSVGRILRAVDHECPFLDPANLWLLAGMHHFKFPDTTWILAPGVRCHEGPLHKAIVSVVVIRSSTENH